MANKDLVSLQFPGLNDTYVIPKEIFICNYGSTTNAEILAAIAANKVPAVVNANVFYVLSNIVTNAKQIFGCVMDDGQLAIATCENNSWSVTFHDVVDLSSSTPSALGTAAAGSSTSASKADHVHSMPSAADVGAIAAPSSPSSGQYLAWNGSAWVAQSLPVYNGGVS